MTSKIDFRNCDCMDLMREFPDKHFDLAIVDPPYGISVNTSMGRRKGDAKSNYKKFAGGDKEPPTADYFEELKRVSKNQIIWGANHFVENIPTANSSCWIVWDKLFSHEVSFASVELAYSSFGKVASLFQKSPANPSRIHPTQKPIELYTWLLANYAKQGDLILDTHVGSASSLIACHQMGFNVVGCELDKEYFELACKRIDEHTAQMRLKV